MLCCHFQFRWVWCFWLNSSCFTIQRTNESNASHTLGGTSNGLDKFYWMVLHFVYWNKCNLQMLCSWTCCDQQTIILFPLHLFLRRVFFSRLNFCSLCNVHIALMHILDFCRTTDFGAHLYKHMHREWHLIRNTTVLASSFMTFSHKNEWNLLWNFFFWLFTIGLIKFAFRMRRNAHITDGNCFERMHSCELHFVRISFRDHSKMPCTICANALDAPKET